jgi:lycopene beta-cyclase
MTPPEYDVILIGAGLANTALVLSLLERNYTGKILLLEKESFFPIKRTWCFWRKDLLPYYLHKLISAQWFSWISSHKGHHTKQSCTDSNYAYACINGNDYYHFCESEFSKAKSVTVMFNQDIKDITDNQSDFSVMHGDTHTTATYILDSRPNRDKKTSAGFYQSFTGARVRSHLPIFNSQEVHLMSDLEVLDNDTLSFQYVLPFSSHEALIEYTCFSVVQPDYKVLRRHTLYELSRRWHLNDQNIMQWEHGCLPMFTQPLEKLLTGKNYSPTGIALGNIRSATGYAFLINHRWAAKAANAIVNGHSLVGINGYSKFYKWIDKLFLNVIKDDLNIAPSLFIDLMKYTSAESFARFMTETASPADMIAIISALPSKPFVKKIICP